MRNVFSRILVGIDESEVSQEAVTLAARLTREHTGELILCHSVNWRSVISEIAATGMVVDTAPVIKDLMKGGEDLLTRAENTAKRAGVDPQRRVLEGEPAESILELARVADCSLIVMGTHGRQGFERLFFGSTTEAVLRGSTIPVLTGRFGGVRDVDAAGRCFERIFVGIDDSEPSDAALETVFALPAEDRQELLFCSAADGARFLNGRADAYVANHELHLEAQRVVARALAAARARGVPAEGRVVDGNPVDFLIATAQEQQADLMVIGSHGRRGVRRFLLGSVAERIVRAARVPVFVVRTAPSAPMAPAAASTQRSRI